MSTEGEWPTTKVALERLRGKCELNAAAKKTLEKLRDYATSPMMGEDCVLPEQEEALELVLEVERLLAMNQRLVETAEGYRATMEKLPVTEDGVRVAVCVDRVWVDLLDHGWMGIDEGQWPESDEDTEEEISTPREYRLVAWYPEGPTDFCLSPVDYAEEGAWWCGAVYSSLEALKAANNQESTQREEVDSPQRAREGTEGERKESGGEPPQSKGESEREQGFHQVNLGAKRSRRPPAE